MLNDSLTDSNTEYPINNFNKKNKKLKWILIGLGVFLTLLIIIITTTISYYNGKKEKVDYINQKNQTNSTKKDLNNDLLATPTTTKPIAILPTSKSDTQKKEKINKNNSSQIEELSFGSFYQENLETIKSNINQLNLPLNIKSDVSNYHKISRLINLDPHLNNLNNYGFSIASNPFSNKPNNFFDAYKTLSNMDIPPIITTDFLIYYYQNLLKDTFKAIEQDSFYNDLWEISKELFVIADKRYKHRLNEIGYTNDLELEAARLEAAFFATALQILKPKQAQISSSHTDKTKFNTSELSKYNFVLPAYLKDDVNPELNLINKKNQITKSPVLLFKRDYRQFNPPNEYKRSAKLSNFYLAATWLNTPFPIFYKDTVCKNCTLDKDDWIINHFAAHLITRDFIQNQHIVNKWATIYKTLAYFKGLNEGITYFHLNDIFNELFPKNTIEEIFSRDNQNIENDISLIQNHFLANKQNQVKEEITNNDTLNRASINFKLLQDQLWPNDYIFKKLTKEAGIYMGNKGKKIPITACKDNKKTYRCRAIALDIANLIIPIPNNNKYFTTNKNYTNYDTASDKITTSLNKFNIHDWHSNNYWNTLDILKTYSKKPTFNTPSYTKNKKWEERKLNTILALWTNLHLPHEKWHTISEKKSSFESSKILNIYVEPEINLLNELKSNTEMLKNILPTLKVINTNDFTYLKLNNFITQINNILTVAKKELINEESDYYDLKNLENFIKNYQIKTPSKKELVLSFTGGQKNIVENINEINFIILIVSHNNEKKLYMGPIFKHTESLSR